MPILVSKTKTQPSERYQPRGSSEDAHAREGILAPPGLLTPRARIQAPSARSTQRSRHQAARGELSGHQRGFLLALDSRGRKQRRETRAYRPGQLLKTRRLRNVLREQWHSCVWSKRKRSRSRSWRSSRAIGGWVSAPKIKLAGSRRATRSDCPEAIDRRSISVRDRTALRLSRPVEKWTSYAG